MGEKRFIEEKIQNKLGSILKILIDKETGVHYLYHAQGYSGGLTPLLDSNGQVVIKKPIKDM